MIRVNPPVEMTRSLISRIKIAVLKEYDAYKAVRVSEETALSTTYVSEEKKRVIELWMKGDTEEPSIEIEIEDPGQEHEAVMRLKTWGLVEVDKGADDPEEIKRVWAR